MKKLQNLKIRIATGENWIINSIIVEIILCLHMRRLRH